MCVNGRDLHASCIVVSQNPGVRLKPNVVLLLDPDKRPYESYPLVSLINYAFRNSDAPVTIRKTLPDGQFGIKVEALSL
jgi:hypothetical protein